MPKTNLRQSLRQIFARLLRHGQNSGPVTCRTHKTHLSFLMTTAVFVSGLLLTAVTSAFAAPPSIEWRRLETEHFEILFDARHEQLARIYAQHAEAAWMTLAPALRAWPDKTVILLDDSVDAANGAASGFPYPTIRLWPAAPVPGESIADIGHWSHDLFIHEYTHVLNFEPAHGLWHPLRNIFGNIVRPNILLPRWYLEGLAVEMETRYSSHGGRLRSPDFLATARAMALDGTLRREEISRVNEVSLPDHPGGARPYLLGGLLWNKLSRERLKVVGDLNDHFAESLPFLLDPALEKQIGKSWAQLLEETYSEIEARARQDQLRVCGAQACVEGQAFGEPGFWTRSPTLSPSGDQLAFLTREHNRDAVLRLSTRTADAWSTAERKTDARGATRLSWLPDGRSILHDGLETFARFSERTELWRYDLDSKKRVRLSFGGRLREPTASPDGRHAFAIQLRAGGTRLVRVRLPADEAAAEREFAENSPGLIEVWHEPAGEERLSWPVIWRDRVYFIERKLDARDELWSLPLNASPAERTPTRHLPQFTSFGFLQTSSRLGLMFTSAQSGISNIYAWNGEQVRPLTNTSTRAWAATHDVTRDELIYSRLDGEGSRLRRLTRADREAMPALKLSELPRTAPLVEPLWPVHQPPEPDLGDLQSEEFTAARYMWPRYWMPYATLLPGGAFVSATTSVGDPIGRHTGVGQLSTDTRIGKPNVFLSYSNFTTPIRFTLMGDDAWDVLSGLDRRSTSADLTAQFFIPGLSNSWSAALSVSRLRTELSTSGSGSSASDVRLRAGPRVAIAYQDVSQRGHEISPESGRMARLAYQRFLPDLGGISYEKTDFSIAEFLSARTPGLSWLPSRHALALNAQASWAPQLDRLFLGPSSISLPIESQSLSSLGSTFVMRGYPSGSFIGKKILRTSAEYRLPISRPERGFGTWPLFMQRWHAAVFGDLLTLEGAVYDWEAKGYRLREVGHMYGAVGLEARLDATVLYHVPIQFTFGLHYGLDKVANPNAVYPVISFTL